MRWLVSVPCIGSLCLGHQLAPLLILWPVGLALLSGCGDAPPKKNLSGTVSYQGNLLDHGSVRFFGVDGRPVGSVIQENGSYQIDLLPGEYQVSVSSPPKMPAGLEEVDNPPPHDPNAVPARYAQPNLSGLSTTVDSEPPTQTYDIVLE